MTRSVLHAHPDRWTVGIDQHLPPEEQVRLKRALVAFAADLLAGASVEIEEPDGLVEDSVEQRDAIQRWLTRRADDIAGALAAALDATVCGAFWESPVFRGAGTEARFHRGFRLLVDGAPVATLQPLAERHGLLLRDR